MLSAFGRMSRFRGSAFFGERLCRQFSVESDFKEAVSQRSLAVRALPDGLEKLELYALYKQATVGDVNADRPGFTDFVGKAKWDAWNKLKGWSTEKAMEQYVEKTGHLVDGDGDGDNDAAQKKKAGEGEERKVWPNFEADTGVMLPPGTFKGKVVLVTGGGKMGRSGQKSKSVVESESCRQYPPSLWIFVL